MTDRGKQAQQVLLECLGTILTPIVRLMLFCGVSYREFNDVAQRVYVKVASQDYGIRGRSTNVSRVATITGLPRKSVSKIRSMDEDTHWSPDKKISPLNTVIHYWRFDPSFSSSPGIPRVLRLTGPESFGDLIRKYAGDVTSGAIKQELLRVGAIRLVGADCVRLVKQHAVPEAFDEDFVRNLSFSLRNLGETLLHNSELVRVGAVTEDIHRLKGRFERYAWSNRLSSAAVERFQEWVRDEGTRFLQRADEWIAANESIDDEARHEKHRPTGVGVYFFLND